MTPGGKRRAGDDEARRTRATATRRAFDELRFGASRTLNLRQLLPTAAQATQRADAWLREQQVVAASEVLIITGRGRGSVGGKPVVRAAIERLLVRLAKSGVVSDFAEHTEGSFVVRLVPFRKRGEARERAALKPVTPLADPASLAGLSSDTRRSLRELAERALAELGAPASPSFVESEMIAQFSRIAAALAPGEDRETALARAIARAREVYD